MLNVTLVCLGNEAITSDSPLLKFLATLLDSDISPDNKTDILQKEFGIKPTRKLKEDFNLMCNLSEGIWEKAMKEGRKAGMQEGRIKGERLGRAEGKRQGRLEGRLEGTAQEFLNSVEAIKNNSSFSITEALRLLGKTMEEYEQAKKIVLAKGNS